MHARTEVGVGRSGLSATTMGALDLVVVVVEMLVKLPALVLAPLGHIYRLRLVLAASLASSPIAMCNWSMLVVVLLGGRRDCTEGSALLFAC